MMILTYAIEDNEAVPQGYIQTSALIRVGYSDRVVVNQVVYLRVYSYMGEEGPKGSDYCKRPEDATYVKNEHFKRLVIN